MDTPPGPLGWMEKALRTPKQRRMHEDECNSRMAFGLARPTIPKGTKILLPDFWAKPEVVADVGDIFTGFHQLTGSCVGVSDGDAIFTLSAVQRMISDTPTKAFVPWWPTSYGQSRDLSGIRGQGEGSITSMIGRANKAGVDDAQLAQFDKSDGWTLTRSLEMQWSNGGSSLVQARAEHAKQFPVGSVASIEDVDGIATSIINGYPILNGCNYYMGSGKLNAQGIAIGSYNGRGGHATTVLGYWEHETLGPLYLYHNQWPDQTYPKDNTGKPRCSVWTPEREMARLFTLGGDDGECMSLSHMSYHPAQPKVLDWSRI